VPFERAAETRPWQASGVIEARLRRLLASLLGALLLGVALPVAAADDHPKGATDATQPLSADLQGYVPGAAYLEGRIRAPCCWNQTIDIHGSEPSNELRREIRRRLRAGETKEAIEASLVDRFGERILAVPSSSPLKSVAAVLLVAMIAAGGGAYALLRRWKARGKASNKAAAAAAESKKALSGEDEKKLEARLDAELQAMDE
jgi:cytochrome c-type biogenesis protein CcmH